MSELFDLKEKIVIITGGSTHLGQAMSEAMCQYGANIIICSRDADRNKSLAKHLTEMYSVDCIGEHLNFANENSIKTLLTSVTKRYGRIDILVNNAAFCNPGKIEEQDYDGFMQGLHGTIGGTYNITRHVLKTMMKQNHGNIINVSSMYGVVSPNPDVYEDTSNSVNPLNYGCGKAAIIQFTKYIACNYAKFNIRANCIVPGAFPNPTVQNDVHFIENLKKKTPINRIGKPEDLKGIIVLLASEASSYITGQSIHVDGGWTAW